jgi:hypothetical protein
MVQRYSMYIFTVDSMCTFSADPRTLKVTTCLETPQLSSLVADALWNSKQTYLRHQTAKRKITGAKPQPWPSAERTLHSPPLSLPHFLSDAKGKLRYYSNLTLPYSSLPYLTGEVTALIPMLYLLWNPLVISLLIPLVIWSLRCRPTSLSQ